ncbi:MAG: thymidine phosphorylase [Planctomycetota bacterium]
MNDLRPCIEAKRDGMRLTSAQVLDAIQAAADGSAPDYQLAALLMAICIRGLARDELVEWTRAMLQSGQTLDFGEAGRPILDKHSTGGIGDKASIPLAPAVAACGGAVPMISGRGLGHTGGTLDKLESIPGLSTEVPLERFAAQLERTGLVFAAQTPELVPADRRLYALRDQTATVESIPLIASSILSKKLAEGLDGLVLDVKFGAGAFLPEPERGAELARTMVELARGFGLPAVALLTAMDRPLGRTIGHALEVRESLDCLRGEGPDDLRALTGTLGGELLALGGLAADAAAGASAIGRALDDGSALRALRETVAEQGGDPRVVDEPERLPLAPGVEVLEAADDGRLGFRALRELGLAVVDLGGGRRRLDDRIDPAVGLELLISAGERVTRGQPWLAIHHRDGQGLESARARCERALDRGPLEGDGLAPLVLDRIVGNEA